MHRFAFQLLSDVHLEMYRDISRLMDIPQVAPYLVLAGDIGYPGKPIYKQFLMDMANRFKKVFVVAGNHEYYNSEYHLEQENMQQICDDHPNLVFLQKGSYLLEETDEDNNKHQLRILGTTLWSNISPENAAHISRSLNDYHIIKYRTPEGKTHRLTTDETQAFHEEELAWLESQLGQAREAGEKVLVVTHHAPLTRGTSNPSYDGDQANEAFSTNLSRLMGEPIAAWFFGHTHYCSDQTVKGTRVISNQMGYMHSISKWFNPALVIEL